MSEETALVSVRVPATSANLGPGFDTMGLALQLYDEVQVFPGEPGQVEVSVTGEGSEQVPLDERHLVVRSLRAAAEACGKELPGLRLRCVNRIPHGRGLGSSAAAIVAGVTVAHTLLGPTSGEPSAGEDMDRDWIFSFAAEVEGHPDNVAPCVYGGFTLAWAGAGQWRCLRQDPDPGLVPVVCVPQERLSTEQARGLLPQAVPHADATRTAGRAALLSVALTRQPTLLVEATQDWLHQTYRGQAMPESAALVHTLREHARLPAVVSGAGPTVLVLGHGAVAGAEGRRDGGEFGDLIRRWAGKQWHIYPVPVDTAGVVISSQTSPSPTGVSRDRHDGAPSLQPRQYND